MNRCMLLASIGVLPWTTLVPTGKATEVAFAFEGQVSRFVRASDDTMTAIPIGTAVTGSYTFDSDASDSESGPAGGTYDNAVTAVSLAVAGNAPVSLDPNAAANFFRVVDGLQGGEDFYFLGTQLTGDVVPGIDVTTFAIVLDSGLPTAFDSDALPLTPPPLSEFPNTSESVFFVVNDLEAVFFNLGSRQFRSQERE